MKTTLVAIGYTALNVRYASLILPIGVVAYLAGIPAWLVWTAAVCLGLAVAAEVFTSAANGLGTAMQLQQRDEYLRNLTEGAEQYANGGWVGLNGDEGEDGEEGGGGLEVKPVPT